MSIHQPKEEFEEEPDPNAPRRIRLAVVDSHRLFRECLAAALRSEAIFARVEVVSDLDQAALVRLGGEPVDVLVLGDGEPGRLHELLREARQRWPGVKILVLGSEEGEDEALALLRAGARGYLFRDQSLDELRDAILEVAAGATVCTPRIAHLLYSRLGELGRERRRDERLEVLELTAREIEILRLISDGLKNQEIAKRLYLSVHTVKNHVHNILERMQVKSRWSAVTHALEAGWLRPEQRASSARSANVFLSFSLADRKIATSLSAELRSLGLEVRSDQPALETGAARRRQLEEAIRWADMVVVLVRPEEPDEAQQYSWQESLAAAWQDPAKRILPVLHEGASVPAFIYSSSRPFQVLRLADPQDSRQIKQVARAVAHALVEGSVSGTSVPDLALKRSERLSEIRRYAELLKEPG